MNSKTRKSGWALRYPSISSRHHPGVGRQAISPVEKGVTENSLSAAAVMHRLLEAFEEKIS